MAGGSASDRPVPARGALATARTSLATALREPGIRAVEAAWTLHTAAVTGLLVTGLLVAYDLAGATGVAILTIARMIPATAVAFLVNVGRTRRLERTLRAVHLLVALAAIVTAAAVAAGSPVVALLAISGAAGVATLVRPTQLALVPALAARPEQLLSANVAMLLGEGLGSLVGPLAAGIVVAAWGPAAGAAVAAGLAGAAALASAQVRVTDAARPVLRDRAPGPPIVDGMRMLAARPAAAVVVGSMGLQVVVRGALLTLVVMLGLEVLAAGEQGVGLLNAAVGLGGLVGAVAALALGSGRRLAPWFTLGVAGWGLPLVGIGAAPTMAVAVTALALVGVSNAILDVSGFTLLQRAVPAARRTSVFAVLESTIGVALAAGGLIAAVIVPLVGVPLTLAIVGAALPLVAVAGWPVVRGLDSEQVVPRETAALLRGVPLFCALPLDGVERVAAALVPVRFAADAHLTVEGEPGTRYYLLTAGTAAVRQGGREIGTAVAGEGVGEVALLGNVPRTATVTATSDIEALALDREDFLAAVLGHPGTAGAARLLVERRLDADRSRRRG